MVWAGENILLDGHNRLDICQAHGIDLEYVEIELADRDAAMLWIEENQLGRRNLTMDQLVAVAFSVQTRRTEIAKRERANAPNRDKWSGMFAPRPLVDNVTTNGKPTERTRASVAKEFGVPERKLRAMQEISKKAPEMANAIRSGQKTISDATREIKRAEVIERLESVDAIQQKELVGEYDVIVIDPPWPMEKIERDVRQNQVCFEYPTMTTGSIAEMKMPAAEDCHLWMWTTHKYLIDAFYILHCWGFKYVCTFVWHKPGGFQPFGLPQYNCEFALYARRGSPSFIDTKAFPVCFNAPRGAHSEKPDAFYEMVRRVTAGRRIDIFNRRNIEGFDVWGKES